MDKPRKFDDVLDECLERLLVKKETVEQCIQRFPEHSRELKPLLDMALAAREASAVKPRAEFRERARYQFKEALLHAESRKSRTAPHFHWGWQPAWVTAVAVLVIISMVGSGTVAAAASSMPDNPLYGVKLATEQVQLTFTFSELGKAELQSKLADKRVSEIAYLTEKGDSEKIAEIAESLNDHLSKITLLVSPAGAVSSPAQPVAPRILTIPATPPAPAPADVVPAPAAAPPQTPGIRPQPAQEAPGVKEKAVVETFSSENESKKKDDKGGEGKEGRSKEDERRTQLKTTVEDRAKDNIARLKALLETAPESSKPALRKALETSEREYKKAVDALDD